jgi:hypothetical protein
MRWMLLCRVAVSIMPFRPRRNWSASRGGVRLTPRHKGEAGMINQLVHLWKFADDADRRAHWEAVFANTDFVVGFASRFRPLVMTQEVKLLHAAPWGPHP